MSNLNSTYNPTEQLLLATRLLCWIDATEEQVGQDLTGGKGFLVTLIGDLADRVERDMAEGMAEKREARAAIAAYRACGDNLTDTAVHLGISRTELGWRLKAAAKFGLLDAEDLA